MVSWLVIVLILFTIKQGKPGALSAKKGTMLLIQADVVDRLSGYASTPSETLYFKI